MKVVLDTGAKLPERAHVYDAGLDLFCKEDVVVPANSHVRVDTGVHLEIPQGYFGLLTSKSGLMAQGITVRGTIDCEYTGTIQPVIFNHSNYDHHFHMHDKVTQLVLIPISTQALEVVDHLETTERGDSGFGSTGR